MVLPAIGVKLHPIWSGQFSEVMEEVKRIVTAEGGCGLTVFLDTEFCRRGTRSRAGEPSTPDGHYAQTKDTVNGGDLVQVGLVITKNNSFEVLGRGCYEFNLLFDASSRPFREVEFLQSHMKSLSEQATQGIPLDRFTVLLRSSGLTSSETVTWITFQAYNDYGYLIRALEDTQSLPEKKEDFLRLVSKHFPSSYDLKVFHRLGICCVKAVKPAVSGVPGSDGLKGLAAGLGVERDDGGAHTAGSDAIFTMRCFHAMLQREAPAFQPMRRYKGILHGLMDPVLSASYARDDAGFMNAGLTHVWAANFSEEMDAICGLFPLIGVVAVEIHMRGPESEVEVAISDARGWVAFDKVWTFHVHGYKEKEKGLEVGIDAAMLAELLTRARVIMSESLTWISSASSTFVYLLDVLTTAPVPPEEDKMFNKLRRAFFPSMAIVRPPVVEGNAPGALDTLRRFFRAGREAKEAAVG